MGLQNQKLGFNRFNLTWVSGAGGHDDRVQRESYHLSTRCP